MRLPGLAIEADEWPSEWADWRTAMADDLVDQYSHNRPTRWVNRSLCKNFDPRIFEVGHRDNDMARSICRMCPVSHECYLNAVVEKPEGMIRHAVSY